MTNHQFVTVTRTLLKRGVTDLERKLVAAASSGAAGYFVLTILHAYGITFPTAIEELVPYASALIGGYIAHSAGSVTTIDKDAPIARDSYHVDPDTGPAWSRVTGDEVLANIRAAQTIVGPVSAPHESRPQTGAIPVQQSFPEPIIVPNPSPAPPSDPIPDEVPDQAPTQAFTQVIEPEASRAQSFMERRAAMRYPYTNTDEPVGN